DLIEATEADKSRVSRWLSESVRSEPSQEYLERLGKLFKVSPDRLYAPPPPLDLSANAAVSDEGDNDMLALAGKVGAGRYQSVDALHVPENARRIPMHPDPRYPLARQFAWEVEGDSMEELRIFEGMWAVGAVADDFKRHYGDIPSGSVVIAQRNRFGGSEY